MVGQRHPSVAPQHLLPRVGVAGGPGEQPVHDLRAQVRSGRERHTEPGADVVRVDQDLVAPHGHEPRRVRHPGGVVGPDTGRRLADAGKHGGLRAHEEQQLLDRLVGTDLALERIALQRSRRQVIGVERERVDDVAQRATARPLEVTRRNAPICIGVWRQRIDAGLCRTGEIVGLEVMHGSESDTRMEARPQARVLPVTRFRASRAISLATRSDLGARRVDVGRSDEVSWMVMADPEGNDFCVLAPLPADPD